MRIQHQLQIGERILDFLALVKADTAYDLVRNAGTPQSVFQRSRLGVGAIKNRDGILKVVL